MAFLTGKSRLKKTPLLAAKALLRRIGRLGLFSIFATSVPRDTRLLYIDIGLHKQALQLRHVKQVWGAALRLRTIGFEAHPDYFRMAAEAVAPGPDDTLHNLAVAGPGQGDSVTLHLNGGDGLGDSIIRAKGGETLTIGAVRLSAILKAEAARADTDAVILRMNIEGAELFVLEDLVEAGIAGSVDGYYGYWDDPMKIGGDIADRFRKILADTGIDNFPFNDRDFKSGLRLAIIKYDMTTSILAALRKR